MAIFNKKSKRDADVKKEDKKLENICSATKDKSCIPRILVYGIERVGLKFESQFIKTRNFEIEFAEFTTNKKFQNYDGVILFQSTFERIKLQDAYNSQYYEVRYSRDELVKRRNQLSQLLDKGGFVCFLIHREFIDRTQYNPNTKDTDLCKVYLNLDSFYRNSLGSDCAITKIYRSEFEPFLKDYGIAKVKFSCYYYESYIRKICDAGYKVTTGFILCDNRYFVPCRLPSDDEIEDFFKKIASSLIATSKKLIKEIPDWVDEYKFKQEKELLTEEVELQNKIEGLQDKKKIYKGYKRCLCYDGELLVESIVDVLRTGFAFTVDDKKEEYIEDKTILNDAKEDSILVEIKGTNQNVKSNNIYQADAHRGRRDKGSNFPSILIMNTFIKSSNSITDKLKDIALEQVKLAVEKKVLVMRTIDLLNLLYLKEEGKINKSDIISTCTKEYGWLKVSQDKYEIIKA